MKIKAGSFALVVIIGFSFAACGTGGKVNVGTYLDGEWINTSEDDAFSIEMEGNNWISYDGDTPVAKGTWTASVTPDAGAKGTITFTVTQIDKGEGWVSLDPKYNSLKSCTVQYSIDSEGSQITLSEKKLKINDSLGLWNKLEGVYTRDGGGRGGKSASSGKGGAKGSAGESDSRAEKQSSKKTDGPPIFYIITGSGTSFTARENGMIIGTANQAIADVIESIRTDADGANVAIQFGNGVSVLNIGDASASFDTANGAWGSITLSGKLTSSASPAIGAYQVFITSIADISTSSGGGSAIINSGMLVINDGTVVTHTADSYGIRNMGGTVIINRGHVSPRGEGIYNENSSGKGGNVTINGGTVYSVSSRAVYNGGGCTVTINGGTLYSSSSETIYNPGGTLQITGGTVSGNHSGHAISNVDGGTVTITGGTVSTTNNNRSHAAIGNDSGCTLTITGGAVIAPGGNAVSNASGGTVTIASPPAVIVGKTSP